MTSQFSLFKQRRFGPFFGTQFLGAFNDNVFKCALLLLITYHTTEGETGMDSKKLVNLTTGLFSLPFFLFSATAGQLADKFEKSVLIRRIKLAEVGIMLLAGMALVQGNIGMLIGVLFLMGTQSAFFGPVKYSILPQQLSDEELVGGNGLVEMGTFLAILIGTMLAGVLMSLDATGYVGIAGVVLVVSLLGYGFSRGIPTAPAAAPGLRINWNPFTETWRTFQFTRKNRTVFLSILGVSWFWFYGTLLMAQLPDYAKEVLHGNEQVVTVLLALFAIGIGTGSLLCERLSGNKVELGLAPFGAIGMTLFGLDLYFSQPPFVGSGTALYNAWDFAQSTGAWRVAMDIVGFGLFGGFFIVPLYALVQQRTEPSHLSRVLAGNNVLNALFMVVATMLAIALLSLGFSIPELFLVAAILNAIVAAYIFTLVPEFLMRFLIWLLIHTLFRVRAKQLEQIPDEGPAVLVANHVSFVDALIIGGSVRRPIRFVMDHQIFNIPVLSFIFRTAGAIPIASSREHPKLLAAAFDEIASALDRGQLVCIFPEGRLTLDGEMGDFRPGIEKIIQRSPVPVVPMALQGLWNSMFSRQGGHSLTRVPRQIGLGINLLCSPPVPAEEVTAAMLQERVQELRGDSQ